MMLLWQKRANRTIWLTGERDEAMTGWDQGPFGRPGRRRRPILPWLLRGAPLEYVAFDRAILAPLEEQVVSLPGGPQA